MTNNQPHTKHEFMRLSKGGDCSRCGMAEANPFYHTDQPQDAERGCSCECHTAPYFTGRGCCDDEHRPPAAVPEAVRWSNEELQNLLDTGLNPAKEGERDPRWAPARSAATSATEKAYPMGYRAGRESRDGEVDDLQGKWTEAQMEVYGLQEQLDGLMEVLEMALKDERSLTK